MAGSPIHVVTGGPGSGKTTLIGALRQRGFACLDEAGRRIIREERDCGGRALPWIDPLAFAERMLEADLAAHASARSRPAPVFADRGAPDIIGYLRVSGLDVPPALYARCAGPTYARDVFVAPPWPAIFQQDEERHQDFALAPGPCHLRRVGSGIPRAGVSSGGAALCPGGRAGGLRPRATWPFAGASLTP